MTSFEKLVSIMKQLRGPNGCPWDKKQTHTSIIPNLVEETYEVIDAIESGNKNHFKEELGDLLLQVVFHAEISREAGGFDIEEVSKEISEKLIRRHPHVFGNKNANTEEEALQNWESEKMKEKSGESVLSGIPRSLPALMESAKLGKKAGQVGFDWKTPADVLEKINEELGEIKEALNNGDEEKISEEMGDFLFALTQWCRHLHIKPEEALRKANQKFRTRFEKMEKIISDEKMDKAVFSIDDWETLWNKIKKTPVSA